MSISSETLSKIKAQLHAATHTDGSVPHDLYSHLTEVLGRIMQYHQKDAYEKFEEISTLVKRTHLNFNDPKTDKELNSQNQKQRDQKDARLEWIKKSKDLLNEVSLIGIYYHQV